MTNLSKILVENLVHIEFVERTFFTFSVNIKTLILYYVYINIYNNHSTRL